MSKKSQSETKYSQIQVSLKSSFVVLMLTNHSTLQYISCNEQLIIFYFAQVDCISADNLHNKLDPSILLEIALAQALRSLTSAGTVTS